MPTFSLDHLYKDTNILIPADHSILLFHMERSHCFELDSCFGFLPTSPSCRYHAYTGALTTFEALRKISLTIASVGYHIFGQSQPDFFQAEWKLSRFLI